MASLRDEVVKLAAEKPELRKHLIPLLERTAGKQAMEFDTKEQLQKYLKDHPNADKSKHKVKPSGSKAPKKPSSIPLSVNWAQPKIRDGEQIEVNTSKGGSKYLMPSTLRKLVRDGKVVWRNNAWWVKGAK